MTRIFIGIQATIVSSPPWMAFDQQTQIGFQAGQPFHVLLRRWLVEAELIYFFYVHMLHVLRTNIYSKHHPKLNKNAG